MKLQGMRKLFVVLTVFLILPFSAQAAVEEGMSQGAFALWLVKAIGAQDQLSPAATADDAVEFLTKLGVIPENGWQKDEPISKAFLASLLGDEEAANLDFNELVERVRAHVQSIFQDTNLGIFRAFGSSSSGSVVAG